MTRPYSDRNAAPRPPADIEREMFEAGKPPGDKKRLLAAQSKYAAWLEEQGWEEPAPEPAGWARDRERKEDDR